MRRSSALLLATLMLIFTLAACGSKDEPPAGGDNANDGVSDNSGTGNGGNQNDPIVGGNTGSQDNGIQDDGTTGSNSAGDGLQDDLDDIGDDIRDDMEQAGDNIRDGVADMADGTANGISANGRRHLGTSFGQMVRNAHVHDKDGDLTDHENAVTPGSDRI